MYYLDSYGKLKENRSNKKVSEEGNGKSVLVHPMKVYKRNRGLCGLVVRVSGYRYRGPGFDPRRYQIF